jgi:hypothetical protein
MAYKVSSEVVSLFKSCYRQIAKIQVLGIEGLEEIKESDILQGGLTIDRYCFSSNALEIGTAIASEATLELKNADGRFDGYTFDGAKLIIHVGIKKWNAKVWENATMHYVPLGVFTIDEKTKNKSNITLNALDNMVKFDREYDTTLAFPATLGEIVEDACSRCGVLLKTTSFYNSDYVVNTRPTDDGLTYRQVIQWAAQLSCTNAFIDWDGQLRLTWFEDSGHIIPAADRYDSDMEEHSVLITGVKVTAADESEYTAGEKGSVLCIEGNSLAQSDAETIAKIIYAKVGNFTYLPYSSVCRPMPYLYPMDMITFVDRRGNEHKTIVSAVTYTMNGTTDVVGEGDGSTKGGYASTGSTTTHEKVIIEKAKKAAEKTSTGQFNVALALNETIGSAFGLYRTEITENKVSTWYYHDKATLNDSTIIYVFNSGGFAWTEDWNDGNPVWQYGFTKDGNALYKILSAYKIQAEFIDANAITSEKIAAGVITADKIKAGAIGGFTIDETHIGIGKTSYDETENDGVYISTSGIGLGKGKFYVDSQGYIYAEEGVIGGCEIKDGVLTVPSANITGMITASQIDASEIKVDAANITGTLSASQIDALGIKIDAADITGVLSSSQINADGMVAENVSISGTFSSTGVNDNTVTLSDGYMTLSQNWNTCTTSQIVSSTGNIISNDRITLSIGVDNGGDARGYLGCGGGTISFTQEQAKLFGTWLGTSSVAITSDVNKKHDIQYLSEEYDTFFDNLIPRLFKYNDGTSDRFHAGFIAQEVETGIYNSSLTTQDFAGFVRAESYNESENISETSCFLRYEEFIALNTWQIQKLKQRIGELESKIGA